MTLELPRTLVAHVAEQAAVSGVTLERWAIDALEVVAASARCRHRAAPSMSDPYEHQRGPAGDDREAAETRSDRVHADDSPSGPGGASDPQPPPIGVPLDPSARVVHGAGLDRARDEAGPGLPGLARHPAGRPAI